MRDESSARVGLQVWSSNSDSESSSTIWRTDMPKASKTAAARITNGPGYEGRFDELGSYTVGFERFSAGGDIAPMFRGLPDDRCQTPHWGVVLTGRLTFTYADGQDVVEAGEAYYA